MNDFEHTPVTDMNSQIRRSVFDTHTYFGDLLISASGVERFDGQIYYYVLASRPQSSPAKWLVSFTYHDTEADALNQIEYIKFNYRKFC